MDPPRLEISFLLTLHLALSGFSLASKFFHANETKGRDMMRCSLTDREELRMLRISGDSNLSGSICQICQVKQSMTQTKHSPLACKTCDTYSTLRWPPPPPPPSPSYHPRMQDSRIFPQEIERIPGKSEGGFSREGENSRQAGTVTTSIHRLFVSPDFCLI